MRAVSIVELEEGSLVGVDDLQDENTKVFRRCDFCEKESAFYSSTEERIAALIKSSQFYCLHCVRNGFYTRKGKHVLILSLRGIISHLYHHCYMVKDNPLFLSQITDMINCHQEIGLLNPLFTYDAESFCWFVDFTRVGAHGRRLPVSSVIDTVNEMITAFNLYEYVKDFKGSVLVKKFSEAVMDFYTRRYRPKDKRLLIPTLAQCCGPVTTTNKTCAVFDYRNFVFADLKLHNRR